MTAIKSTNTHSQQFTRHSNQSRSPGQGSGTCCVCVCVQHWLAIITPLNVTIPMSTISLSNAHRAGSRGERVWATVPQNSIRQTFLFRFVNFIVVNHNRNFKPYCTFLNLNLRTKILRTLKQPKKSNFHRKLEQIARTGVANR